MRKSLYNQYRSIKYLISKSRRSVTMVLDPANFYRTNKKYLLHIESLRKFQLFVAGRIEGELISAPKEMVFINQVSMQDFRRWLTKSANKQLSQLF
jgi:two-component system, LytTR family, response regulator LytT